jgi:hypothetical protein
MLAEASLEAALSCEGSRHTWSRPGMCLRLVCVCVSVCICDFFCLCVRV